MKGSRVSYLNAFSDIHVAYLVTDQSIICLSVGHCDQLLERRSEETKGGVGHLTLEPDILGRTEGVEVPERGQVYFEPAQLPHQRMRG